jgi:serine/threonine protein kinase
MVIFEIIYLKARKVFAKGDSTSDQFMKIIGILGSLNEEELLLIPNLQDRNYIANLPKEAPKEFENLFPTASPECLDILRKMLTFDHKKRLTAVEALNHPYFKDIHLTEGNLFL